MLRSWRFVTLLLAAVGLAPGTAHVLEFPPKMAYDPELDATVTSTLYQLYGSVGARILSDRLGVRGGGIGIFSPSAPILSPHAVRGVWARALPGAAGYVGGAGEHRVTPGDASRAGIGARGVRAASRAMGVRARSGFRRLACRNRCSCFPWWSRLRHRGHDDATGRPQSSTPPASL